MLLVLLLSIKRTLVINLITINSWFKRKGIIMAAYKNPIPTLDFSENKKKHNVEIDENDYTTKESVYFAFIDVLGFKKVFDDNRITNNGPRGGKFAEKFKEVFKYYFNLMNSANFARTDRTLCYAGQTSDSLYFYTESEAILIEFIKIFSHFNVYAMTQDVFFRGGIAKGNLSFKKDYQFYGDSVIYAYLLESEVAKNPIIMIDENTYEALKSSEECNTMVDVQKNGRIFIKPFAFLQYKYKLDISDRSMKVRKIEEKLLHSIIKKNKSKFEYDSRNYEKYVYLLNQYDEYKKNI